MRTRSTKFALIASTFLFVACSGNDGDDGKIGPPDGPPAPRDVDPIAGGGTSGGPIEDVLTVFVLDADGAAITSATVLVQHGGKDLVLKTDAEGRVDFYEKGLDGTLSLHVFAAGYEFSSAYGFDASVVTIELDDGRDREPPEAVAGTVTGTITGWDLLPPNGTTAARVVNISALGDDIADLPQRPRPGTVTPGDPDGTDYNVVINGSGNFPMWTDYSLEADTRAEKILALGGIFELTTQVFTPSHLGIADVTVTEGMSVQADVELTHAFDQTLTVDASAVPMLDQVFAIFSLRLPPNDILLPVSFVPSPPASASAEVPALTGALAGARYLVGVQASSEVRIGDEPMQRVYAIREGTETSFTIDDILSPPSAPTATGRTIGTMPVTGATMHIFELRTAEDDRSLWSVAVRGDGTSSIELPAVPDGLTDPATGSLILEVSAVDLGDLDLDAASFKELQDAIRSGSESRAAVSL